MGNYERTYNAIHKYKMGKLFWQAKMKDLEGEYIRVVRAMCEWEWNNRKGVLVLSLGGNESRNYINKMISECEISIREYEGYLR